MSEAKEIALSEESQALNASVTEENRRFLDLYIDMLIDGNMDPLIEMSSKTGVSKSKLGRFLATPEHQAYIKDKLNYWLVCADIDKFRLLTDLRTITNTTIVDFIEPNTNQNGQVNFVRLKNFSDIPKEKWKAVKKLEFNQYGMPKLELHSADTARTLIAKIQHLLSSDININKTVTTKDRLFDLKKADAAEVKDVITEDDPTRLFSKEILATPDFPETPKTTEFVKGLPTDIENYSQQKNQERAQSFAEWSDSDLFYNEPDEDEDE